jgi:hypothetical protein
MLLILFPLIFFGCSGISTRIHEHQPEFSSYPAAVQEKIKSGRIEPGFTETMVYLAKGKPDKKKMVLEDHNSIVIWIYQKNYSNGGASSSLSSPFGFPVVGPGPVRPVEQFSSYSSLIVRFKNGKVIDQMNQDH